MAVLTNGVETIEVGSRTWRIISNNNFQMLDDLITEVHNIENDYAKKDLSNVSNSDFKDKGNSAGLAYADLSNVDNDDFKDKGNNAGLAYADLSNIADTAVTDDIIYTDETKGLVLVDRSDTTKSYRLYVDNGSLEIEEI